MPGSLHAFDAESVIRRCLAGEEDAWRAFVDSTVSLVAASVRRRCGAGTSQDDIDDRIQDVYLRLLSRDGALLRSWDPARSSLSTWLSLIAHSTCIDHARKRRRDHEPLSEAAALAGLDPQRMEVEYQRLLDCLPPRQRLVVEMVIARGLDVAAVASVLQVEPQTVRSLKHKALTALRERAAGRQEEGMPAANRSYNPQGASA